jgi:hypothetical protein
MGYVASDVLRDNPLYAVQPGFFLEASPPSRRRFVESGLCVLADLPPSTGSAPGSTGSRLPERRA